ncbi:hypothetical protein IFM89_036623 [Coptis chinensis]|uniref:Uncharacterized protein n=1 Tax=Coptis chinensis TaxID=261450 RepID=A0A835HHG9_9MAGN|nr:hypothetical protein IFM89_036623 [Coptis chinensis]
MANIANQEQAMFKKNSDEALVRALNADYYVHRIYLKNRFDAGVDNPTAIHEHYNRWVSDHESPPNISNFDSGTTSYWTGKSRPHMSLIANGQENEVAAIDIGCGKIYLSLNLFDEADFSYQKVLTVFKSTKGDNQPSVASVFTLLPDLYYQKDRLRESDSYC